MNAGKASSEVKRKLKQLNIPAQRIKRLVIALYESEVNVVAHATEGDIEVSIEADRIHVMVADRGPGIADLAKAMEEGFSTASREVREMGFGAGMGLPNIKRNSDHLEIDSTPGQGTIVRITNELKD